MWILPYRKLSLKTRFKKERVIKKIRAITHTYPNILASWFLYSEKPYQGKVNTDDFEIRRKSSRPTNLLPQIKRDG